MAACCLPAGNSKFLINSSKSVHENPSKYMMQGEGQDQEENA